MVLSSFAKVLRGWLCIPGSGKDPDLVRASSLSHGQKKTGQIKEKKNTKIFTKNGLALGWVALGFYPIYRSTKVVKKAQMYVWFCRHLRRYWGGDFGWKNKWITFDQCESRVRIVVCILVWLCVRLVFACCSWECMAYPVLCYESVQLCLPTTQPSARHKCSVCMPTTKRS